jgi:DNA-binding LacI/PurR family transcriptional regulator
MERGAPRANLLESWLLFRFVMKTLRIVIPPDNVQATTSTVSKAAAEAMDTSRWSLDHVHLAQYNNGGGSLDRLTENADAFVICFPGPADYHVLDRLLASGRPVVTYNRDLSSRGAMGVVCDVRNVITDHFNTLYAMGKRRFAVIAFDRPSPTANLFAPMVHTLCAQHGIADAFQSVEVKYTASHRPSEDMLARIAAVMNAKPGPDAVICAEIYSFQGLEAWLALNPHVRVPEDVGIAAFDYIHYPHVSRLRGHFLNSSINAIGMMSAAMELIEDSLAGRKVDPLIRLVPAILHNQ